MGGASFLSAANVIFGSNQVSRSFFSALFLGILWPELTIIPSTLPNSILDKKNEMMLDGLLPCNVTLATNITGRRLVPVNYYVMWLFSLAVMSGCKILGGGASTGLILCDGPFGNPRVLITIIFCRPIYSPSSTAL